MRGSHELRERRRLLAGGDNEMRARRILREPRTELIIDVDHARDESRGLEQQCFRRAVFLHRAVVIEVVACEVGEYGRVETHAVHTPLLESVRGHFHPHAFRAELAQFFKLSVHGDGV
jgi:hypothetical protein